MKTMQERKEHIQRWNGFDHIQGLAVKGCYFGLALWLVCQCLIKCGVIR